MAVSPETLDMLYRIAAALQGDGPLEVGTMFRSPGLRTGTSIVAFLGSDDRFLVKVPRERATVLVHEELAEPVTMGARTMREWVSIPADADPAATEARWTSFAREAFEYVRTLT
jgi:hypothetical protein